MTLDNYFKLTGKLLYPGQNEVYRGQCVQSVMIKMKDVDGVEPPVYPNAKDYWFNSIPGYIAVSPPQPGDIVVYNGHGSFPEGHIAVVAYNGQVFEQNADPDGSAMHFATRSNTYLLGYLRKKGANMPTKAQADKIALFSRLLQFKDVAGANSFNASDTSYIMTGDPFDKIGQLLEDIKNSPEWKDANEKKVAFEKGISNAQVLKPNTLYKTP